MGPRTPATYRGGHFVRGLPGDPGGGQVKLLDDVAEIVIGLGHRRAVEAVGFNDVRTGFQIGLMDLFDHVGTRQGKEVIVAFQVAGVILEALAAVVRFLELVLLDHGTHSAVYDENSLGEGFLKRDTQNVDFRSIYVEMEPNRARYLYQNILI